ncbi:MAG: hypothetical protein ACRBFS_09535 [Aureispira sp.]
MKQLLQQLGFEKWGKSYRYDVGTRKIFLDFKAKNKKQVELLHHKYPTIAKEVLAFYSQYNGLAFTLQGRSNNLEEAKICSLNELFDKFKEEAIPFPDNLDIVAYNNDFDLQESYLKKEDPFFRKLYAPEEFEEFDTLKEVQEANIIRRAKKLAPIFGYDDDIVIDFQATNENTYQIYLLSGRSGTGQGLYPMDIDFQEFLNYFLLFGFVGHWYTAFIPLSSFTKKELRVKSMIKELEKYFRASPIHQEPLNTLISKLNKFQ